MNPAQPRPGPRERLREAAERLFLERGADVSLREIAHEAGTREETAIKYFADINGLLDPHVRTLIRMTGLLWKEAKLNELADGELEAAGARATEVLRSWVKLIEKDCRASKSAHRDLARISAQLSHRGRSPIVTMIKDFREGERETITNLCQIAGFNDSEMLAHKIILLTNGALADDRTFYSSARKLPKIVDEMFDAHRFKPEEEECPDDCDCRADRRDGGENSGERRL